MEDNSSADPKDIEIWITLKQASHAIMRVRQKDFYAAGLTEAQAGLLHVIRNEDCEPIQANISRFLFREPHTIFSLVKNMEKRGFITRHKDMARKNWVRLEITEKGEDAYQRSRQNVGVISELLSCLTEKEKIFFIKTSLRYEMPPSIS